MRVNIISSSCELPSDVGAYPAKLRGVRGLAIAERGVVNICENASTTASAGRLHG